MLDSSVVRQSSQAQNGNSSQRAHRSGGTGRSGDRDDKRHGGTAQRDGKDGDVEEAVHVYSPVLGCRLGEPYGTDNNLG